MSKNVKGFKDFRGGQPLEERDVSGLMGAGGEKVDFETPEGEEEADFDEDDGIPAIFATIHFKSDARPNGYTAEDIAEMNRLANERVRGKKAE